MPELTTRIYQLPNSPANANLQVPAELPGGATVSVRIGDIIIAAQSPGGISNDDLNDLLEALNRGLNIKEQVDYIITENVDVEMVADATILAVNASYLLLGQIDKTQNGVYSLNESATWIREIATNWLTSYGPGSLFMVNGPAAAPDNRLFYIPWSVPSDYTDAINFSFTGEVIAKEFPRALLTPSVVDRWECTGTAEASGYTSSSLAKYTGYLRRNLPFDLAQFYMVNGQLLQHFGLQSDAGSFGVPVAIGMMVNFPNLVTDSTGSLNTIEFVTNEEITTGPVHYICRLSDAWVNDQINMHTTPLASSSYYGSGSTGVNPGTLTANSISPTDAFWFGDSYTFSTSDPLDEFGQVVSNPIYSWSILFNGSTVGVEITGGATDTQSVSFAIASYAYDSTKLNQLTISCALSDATGRTGTSTFTVDTVTSGFIGASVGLKPILNEGDLGQLAVNYGGYFNSYNGGVNISHYIAMGGSSSEGGSCVSAPATNPALAGRQVVRMSINGSGSAYTQIYQGGFDIPSNFSLATFIAGADVAFDRNMKGVHLSLVDSDGTVIGETTPIDVLANSLVQLRTPTFTPSANNSVRLKLRINSEGTPFTSEIAAIYLKS